MWFGQSELREMKREDGRAALFHPPFDPVKMLVSIIVHDPLVMDEVLPW